MQTGYLGWFICVFGGQKQYQDLPLIFYVGISRWDLDCGLTNRYHLGLNVDNVLFDDIVCFICSE